MDRRPGLVEPPWMRTKAKHVSDLVSGVLNDVVARRSGMTIDLLAGWADIVGPDYADFTLPEKINWPNPMTDTEPFQPGVLVVACDGKKALFFQHETAQILERVNFFFGFEAIAKLKLIQKPIQKSIKTQTATVRLSDEERARLDAHLDLIQDETLRKKLERFGKGVILRSNSMK